MSTPRGRGTGAKRGRKPRGAFPNVSSDAPRPATTQTHQLLSAVADDDHSTQLSWPSESKNNLKIPMDNFSPTQYDRFKAYRRHALPKQAVRKVIQQTTGQQVS
ncbi:hypothetical protein BV22DRAFT_1128798 [Leucogyrophana mollusca]|uniref:Uncharacterized protein n=1 Tax=Leucogyrophana mollusca TaxID=85980 RepID=A0ACB8BKD0_9AGAM|nr:hypothetical protein BV22DRAFT_1128798 [Leucogyrophana mollusca]